MKKLTLVFSILASVLLVADAAFRWSLIERLFFLYSVFSLFIWLLFGMAAVFGFVRVFKYAKQENDAWLPLKIQLAALLLIIFVPFTMLWLKFDFYFYRAEREAIVHDINSGKYADYALLNNRYSVPLKDSYPNVSMGGNEVMVEEVNGLYYVFFYTFRGILDNYAGFIYVPTAGDPSQYGDLNESRKTELRHLDGNWYYASHH